MKDRTPVLTWLLLQDRSIVLHFNVDLAHVVQTVHFYMKRIRASRSLRWPQVHGLKLAWLTPPRVLIRRRRSTHAEVAAVVTVVADVDVDVAEVPWRWKIS